MRSKRGEENALKAFKDLHTTIFFCSSRLFHPKLCTCNPMYIFQNPGYATGNERWNASRSEFKTDIMNFTDRLEAYSTRDFA